MKTQYNHILDQDSYKASHWLQYPPNTTGVFSYIESRGGDYDYTVFFGLQYFLKQYLSAPITMAEVEEAQEFLTNHGLPFNYDGWKRVVEKHDGLIPVRIRAVPEGSKIPTHNILLSVESTDPELYWLPSWIETQLLRVIWYGTTVATRSNYIKSIIMEYLNKTAKS